MKEEIKEILELLAFTDENIMFCDIVELNSKRSHLLLDYITNLQEKCENYRKLKERYQIEKELYKQRNEKAIEDLEKTKELNDKHILARDNIIIHLDIDHIEYLLNILKGDKDE